MLIKKVKRKLLSLYYYPYVMFNILQYVKGVESNRYTIILPMAIGDFCYALAYMRELCMKKESEGKDILLVVYDKRKSLLTQYELDYPKIFIQKGTRESQIVDWIAYNRYLMKFARKHNIYTTVAYYETPERKACKSCLDISRYNIFKLEGKGHIVYPCVPNCEITSISDFDEVNNRIVILNPYSNSLELKDNGLFEELSSFLHKKGYVLYTNVIPGQKIVKGTYPLACSIIELYNICKRIPLVISIRSGIIDYLISSPAHFFVIYEQDVSPKYRSIYALDAWQTNNVYETVYTDRSSVLTHLYDFINNNRL